jgi:hypothetical protein
MEEGEESYGDSLNTIFKVLNYADDGLFSKLENIEFLLKKCYGAEILYGGS